MTNVAAMVMGYLLTFGLTVLASRWLQPKRTGELFELIAIFTIVALTLQLGTDTGLTRWISRARAIGGISEVRQVIAVALVPVAIIGIAAGLAIWLAAPALSRLLLHALSQPQGAADIRIIAPIIPAGALSACLIAAARGFGRMWPGLWIEGLGKPVLRITLAAGALAAGWGLRGVLIAWIIPVPIGLLASWLIVSRLIKQQVPDAHSLSLRTLPAGRTRPLATGFWRFTAPRGLAGIFQVTVGWLDILLVGAMLTSYDAGVYSAVSRLAMLGAFALEGTRLAIAPQLGGLLARREYAQAGALYQSATRMLMLASWPLYLLFAIFPTVVLGIFGHRYGAGATCLVVLALAMLVNTGTGNVTVVLLMGGKSSWNVLNTLAALIVNVGLNLVLLPRIGIVGAAIAWAASIVVDNLAAVAEVWFVLGIAPTGPGYGLVVAAAAGCFGIIGLAVRAGVGQSLPALALAASLGLIGYGVVLYTARRQLGLAGFLAAILPGGKLADYLPGGAQPGRHRAMPAARSSRSHVDPGRPASRPERGRA